MNHNPVFWLRQDGSECAGDCCIYDGDEPVARLERRVVGQPEQVLLYLNAVPRPIVLRHLKLKPGGRPSVSGVQMYWNLPGKVPTTELVSLDVEGNDTDRLRLTVLARDAKGIALSRRILTLTFDPHQASYVYDFECCLDVLQPERVQAKAPSYLEYSDPWYVDLPGPSVRFPGMWRRRPFTCILCDAPGGKVHQLPLNHIGMLHNKDSRLRVRPNGLLFPAFQPGDNPAIQFVGDEAAGDEAQVCFWGYDIVLAAPVPPTGVPRKMFRRFRVLSAADDLARRWMDAAGPAPRIELCGMAELPLYERETSFEKPCPLNEAPPGDTEPWSWVPSGEGVAYEREFGRSDRNSLKITRLSPGLSQWSTDREGEGSFTERWADEMAFRVSAYVKTRDVTGKGACIAMRWTRYNQQPIYAYTYSQRLLGTNDWTKLVVEFSGRHPEDSSAVEIALTLDGAGIVWFDDLKAEVRHGAQG